jgi:SpoVK/Ycf46/Vps4 family AAA+-type ATPase
VRGTDEKRILLLSGPAGAGKTTTVRVVAKEMGVELMEWGEGADDSIVGVGLGRSAHSSEHVGTDDQKENLQLLNSSPSYPGIPTPP